MLKRKPANNKTQPNDGDVAAYLKSIDHVGRREDAFILLELFSAVTGEPARLWGESMIGFGQYHYVYESGREGDHFLTGFAPRKANMVVYVMPGFSAYGDLLDQLGKCRTSRSCLYLGRLSTIDLDVLRRLVDQSVGEMRRKYKV